MLPTEDAAWVAEELHRRFGLPLWQMAMTATDANRFVLRFARHLTGRPKIAVMDWCYHGTVDEAFAVLDAERRGRSPARLARTTGRPGADDRVVPFNDLDALDAALASRRRRLCADGAGAHQHRHTAGDVVDWDVVRWGGALPFASLGHKGRVAEVRSICAADGTLAVVGGWLSGNGLAAIVADTPQQVRQLLS